MRPPAPGETWDLAGTWETHPSYGRQVRVHQATLTRPSGRIVVQAIGRDAKRFPKLGVVRATALWREHGAALFDRLDAGDPAPFIDHLGPELAAVLLAGWKGLDHDARAYRWLTERGFAPAIAQKVMAIYGAMPVPPAHATSAALVGPVVWHLEDDPYRMLAFASWKAVDAAARRMSIASDDPRRLAGAVEAACAQALAVGHTWVPAEMLRPAVARLLAVRTAAADTAIAHAVDRKAVLPHAGGYQLPGLNVMEQFVERRIHAMHTGLDAATQLRLAPPMTRELVDALLNAFDMSAATRLTHEQRDAVWMAVTERVSLLLGGPGVGKTTVLKAVHHVATAMHQTVHQAALAGRAARRMQETTGHAARTLMGLQMAIDKAELALDDEPLVVIDEASMCDLATVYRLLRRFPNGVRVLLVGDPGQLPPIGFGLTFHVLARAADIPRTTLTRVMRQTAASGIPAVCSAIRAGRVPALAAPDWDHPDGVSFIETAADDVTHTVIDVLARAGGVGSAQVVGSVKRGPGGTIDINACLQALCGPPKAQLNGHFYAGDPVIATHNDMELGVLNGDLGVALADTADGGLRCRFDAGEIDVPPTYLAEHLELAYAITTHKAQGSEFPCVIIPVTASRLLDRTLLLTAVSRARRQAILVGDRELFAQAVTAPATSDVRLVGLGRPSATTPSRHPSL